MVIQKFLENPSMTLTVGRWLGRSLPSGTILLLEGDLGAGKTTLVQGLAQGLGILESILSPTFTLICEYVEGRLPLYHLDLYRLQNHEVRSLHPEVYWQGDDFPLGIVAIEWADRLPSLPDNYLKIQLDYQSFSPSLNQWEAVKTSDDFTNIDSPSSRMMKLTSVGNTEYPFLAELTDPRPDLLLTSHPQGSWNPLK
jgi:tRNA threonylcarbamoyladenosine biosynthesis protein TsaE